MSKLSSEMKALAKKAGGSFKTVNDRIHITKRFSEHLRALNIQIQRVEQIKVRHIECYIEERLEQDIGLRTLQNDMAALQAVLRQAGRRQVVEHPRLTNKALGVSGASRNGTRRAITPEHYQQVMEKARTEDAGLAAALEIARLMGLRSQEAVQSSQSLKTWLKAIERGEKPAESGVWHQRRASPLYDSPGYWRSQEGSGKVLTGRGSTQWQADRQA